MYESYWQLDEKPFENTSDERFYYPSEVHQGALLKLRYIIENRRGGALLAGAAGLGKTLLVSTLIRQLPDELGPLVHLVYPKMPPEDLLAYLAGELTDDASAGHVPTIEQSVRRIRHALVENTKAGRHAIVAVDEAHLLKDSGALESLRLLLNFEIAHRPSMTLLLIGQPSLLPALDYMPGVEERLGIKCLMRPFTLEETISYVNHRLHTAGSDRSLFEADALESIHELTHGVPRRINRLCDLALLIGFAEEQSRIGAEQIEAVSEELIAVRPE